MESYIKLSTLNDFMFCPKSIYYHNLYDSYEKKVYQDEAQIAWTIAHEAVDNKTYSSSKNVLLSLDVYCHKYGIAWKIDQFFIKEWKLIERKNKIHIWEQEDWKKKENIKIYIWYKYQLWGQMFCLEEMWYDVSSLAFYSMSDNKTYRVYKPSPKEILDFENMLEKYRKFDLLSKKFSQNTQKCLKCIYKELCDYFIGEVYPQLSLFEAEKK